MTSPVRVSVWPQSTRWAGALIVIADAGAPPELVGGLVVPDDGPSDGEVSW